MEGRGVPQDEKEVVKWYRKAAEQEEARAQTNLGICYMEGRGVPQDEKDAVTWFRKAAKQGDAVGLFLMGICYEEGIADPVNRTIGTNQDFKAMMECYEQAAKQGYAPAQTKLGTWYISGVIIAQNDGRRAIVQDINKGVEWVRKAKNQGDPEAQEIWRSPEFQAILMMQRGY
jgi:TPR repeat protein